MKKLVSVILVLLLTLSCAALADETRFVSPSEGVNMRAGADLESAVIDCFAAGTQVSVISAETEGFVLCRVDLGGCVSEGYIWFGCLGVNAPEAAKLSEGATMYVKTWEGLNVRSAASLSSDIVASIGLNTQLTVTGTQGEFAVVCLEKDGVICNGYVWADCLADVITSEDAAKQIYLAKNPEAADEEEAEETEEEV